MVLVLLSGSARAQGGANRLLERPNILPNSTALVKSLGDAAEYVLRWKPPQTLQSWRIREPQVRKGLLESLGLSKLPPRTPLNARIVSSSRRSGYWIDNLIFESRPGFPVSANLYRPDRPAPHRQAAVILPIGHYLLPGKSAQEVQLLCIGLARKGIIVLTYDAIGHGERMISGNIHHEAGYALLPLGQTIAGWMVWDTMRAIDYLLTRQDVDPARLAVTGNSGGGMNALLTAALDTRIHMAVVVGFTFEFNHWIKYAGAHCTCTHIPGLFQRMEWFEIAGLIAPRGLLLLQGEHDDLFPVAGARRAARSTAAVYRVHGASGRFQFTELPRAPHAYSEPFRAEAYTFLARNLLQETEPVKVEELEHGLAVEEHDSRLECRLPHSPSVVELAREEGLKAVRLLPDAPASSLSMWLRKLTASEEAPSYPAPIVSSRGESGGVAREELSLVSEDGVYLPATLRRPRRDRPVPVAVIVNDQGRSATANSELPAVLLESGYAVMAVDLRGRGETLGRFRPQWNTNFRLVMSQTLMGQPLAGRRALDLRRTIDYLATRTDLSLTEFVVIGLGDDSLPVLMAAATDPRIRRVVASGYLHSFLSQMIVAKLPAERVAFRRQWNDATLDGRVHSSHDDADFGSVIPAALEHADVPDLVAAIGHRPVLFAGARDLQFPRVEPLVSRFRSLGGKALTYRPERTLDATLLMQWLRESSGAPGTE